MAIVEVVSREIVKPFLPTPDHLGKHKFSFLDHQAPFNYDPILLFYNPSSDLLETLCSKLKKSLANILTLYYPLAGKVCPHFVTCNDDGVEFLEARVRSCDMSHFTESPNLEELNRLLPFPANSKNSAVTKTEPMVVQFNKFDCGGLVIGICICHKIADGCSIVNFLNSWACVSRGEKIDRIESPNFDGALYFPPDPNPSLNTQLDDGLVTKRFVFDKSTIAALQEKVSSDGRKPSRVLALSAFIWKRFMAAIKSKSGEGGPDIKVWTAVHAVNVRQRTAPPLPDLSFGNFWTTAYAPMVMEETHTKDYGVLVNNMRDAIKRIEEDGVGVSSIMEKKLRDQYTWNEMEFDKFTSWCRFPVYDIDFGFGKPDWVCTPNRPIKTVIILTSTKYEDGIEAWMSVAEKDMPAIERDPELLPFLSFSFNNITIIK